MKTSSTNTTTKDTEPHFDIRKTGPISANIERFRCIMEYFPAPGDTLDREYVIPNDQSNLERVMSIPAAVVTGTLFGAFVLVFGTASNILSVKPRAALDTAMIGGGLILNGLAAPIVDPILAIKDKLSGIPFQAVREGHSTILGFPVASHSEHQASDVAKYTPAPQKSSIEMTSTETAAPQIKPADNNVVHTGAKNTPDTHPQTTADTAKSARITSQESGNHL